MVISPAYALTRTAAARPEEPGDRSKTKVGAKIVREIGLPKNHKVDQSYALFRRTRTSRIFALPGRSVRIEDRLLPSIQMQVLGSPGQHGKRHAEIVVLPCWAFIDHTAVALFAFERHELLIGASDLPMVGQAGVMVMMCRQHRKVALLRQLKWPLGAG